MKNLALKLTRRKKLFIIGALILFAQLILFRDYIVPFHWGQIKVKGLACTCPDEVVVSGQLYLKNTTPDSLKQYTLDYSEIYVTDRPSTISDPMGVGTYILEGQIIGKDRVSEGDSWNPKFRVDKWREVGVLGTIVKGFLFVQLVIWLILLQQSKKKNSVTTKPF